jgi:hypothetical protein
MSESKTTSKPKRKTKGQRADHVQRISKDNYDRLKAFGETESLNALIDRVLSVAETVRDADTVYLWGDQVFYTPEMARGEAIVKAAKWKQEIEWPEIAIVIGRDSV